LQPATRNPQPVTRNLQPATGNPQLILIPSEVPHEQKKFLIPEILLTFTFEIIKLFLPVTGRFNGIIAGL